MNETPEDVVKRELARWRMWQKHPIVSSAETLEEIDSRLAYLDELRALARQMYDDAKQRQRDMYDEALQRARVMYDDAMALRNHLLEENETLRWYQYQKQLKRDALLRLAFPCITWRDNLRALWE
jgi:hypothetical protein